MAVRFQLRGGTSTEWSNANPILLPVEIGVETDTKKIKIGNGVDTWSNLLYMTQGLTGPIGETGEAGPIGETGEAGPIGETGLTGDIGIQGEQGIQGNPGNDLEYIWVGTELGVREEGTTIYNYVDLKGETGDITGLDKSAVETALGYTVNKSVPSNALFTDTTYNLTPYMPKSGGVLENYTEKLTTTTGAINLSLGNVFTDTPSANRTYSITNAVSGVTHSFTLIIDMGATIRTLGFPASVKWRGGEIPDMTTTNKTYVLTFVTIDGGTNWLGMFGGEF